MDCLWTTLPLVDLSMLIFLFTTKWLLWMPGMTLMTHHVILSLPPADLDTVCFSFSRSTILPPAAQLFKECWGLHCHFYQRFYILNRCSSVFDNLPCSGINSHISKIMSIQSLVCWNEIKDFLFENLLKIKLFDQRPNIRYSKYTVLWLSCILKTEIDPL